MFNEVLNDMSSLDDKSNDEDDDSDESDESESENTRIFKWDESELKPIKTMKEFNKRFTIGKYLGGGGDGNVYSDALKQWAAIKTIEITNINDSPILQDIQIQYEKQRAQQEQRLLSKSKIANIYGIYYNSKKQILYKIYDRYEYSLADIIDKLQFGMNESQVKYIIFDICRAIKKLHHQNFIHCDIKPSNCMYCKKGTYSNKYKDKHSFKLIDFDGVVWNKNDDIVNVQWQGTLPFIAPEMNDYTSDNNIGYGLDIWSVGLLIIYCINGGDLGLMDIDDDDYKRFYQEYEEYDEEEIKSTIFDDWYNDLFNEKMTYQNEIKILFKEGKISKDLYDLLYYGILIKDPQKRMTINEVLSHKWFDSIYENNNEYIYNVSIHNKLMDVYDAIMSDDTMIRFEVIKQLGFDINDIDNESSTDDDNYENSNKCYNNFQLY